MCKDINIPRRSLHLRRTVVLLAYFSGVNINNRGRGGGGGGGGGGGSSFPYILLMKSTMQLAKQIYNLKRFPGQKKRDWILSETPKTERHTEKLTSTTVNKREWL